ncbi:hypothetical protein GCM10022225_26410 [Plantactinospora mayteni]|uniref:DUF3558 domain-containing protein n=1 Tax=Plantactinospora mayteni TaxID=566021 RepID=A0ABQ4EIR7_9ACTN|nr:hypothetical protein [Plantactinospora mayteni]GIG94629.1 hypothetical protein Pma05_12020 [Plantactinospora mayteni]
MSYLVDNDGTSSASRGQDVLQELTHQRRRSPLTVVALVAAIAIGSVLATAILYWPADRREGSPLVETSDLQPDPGAAGISVSPGSTRGTYRAVDRPCAAVGWAPIAAEVGRLGTDSQESSTSSGSVATMRCSVALGEGGNHGVAMAEITIFENSSAEDVYENLRRAHSEEVVLTPVAGLGTAAYAYVEKADGPAVATYDGNLYLRLVWVSLQRQMPPVDSGITRALAEVARQTLDYLRV